MLVSARTIYFYCKLGQYFWKYSNGKNDPNRIKNYRTHFGKVMQTQFCITVITINVALLKVQNKRPIEIKNKNALKCHKCNIEVQIR